MAYGFTAVVDAAAGATATTITRTVTYSSGDIAVVWIEWAGITGTVTVTDGTNTYTQAGPVRLLNATKTRSRVACYCLSPAAGAVTVTATFSASKLGRRIAVERLTGLSAYQVELGAAQVAPGTGTDAITTGSLTPTAQPAGAFALSNSMNNTAPTLSAGTGYTTRGNLASWDAASTDTTQLEDKRITSTSGVAATFTTNGATEDFLSQALILTEPTVISVSSAGAIASAEAFGTAAFTRTSVAAVSGTGIASAEAFGTAVVGHVHAIAATAIASAEAFGTAVFTRTGPALSAAIYQRISLRMGLALS